MPRAEESAGSCADLVLIDRPIIPTLIRHAREEYPNECCGILIGSSRERNGHRETRVETVVPAVNTADGDRTQRYTIAPETLIRILERTETTTEELVGYYHSHTRGDSIPSQLDRQAAWPGVSYLILGTVSAGLESLRSWRLAPDRESFQEERVEVSDRFRPRS